MSQDHIQRQIDFMVEQQAKFSADIVRLEEQTRQNTENITSLTGHIGNLVDTMLSLTHIVEAQADQIGVLIEQSKETDRRLMETDERLSALINVVEKFISSQNGK